MRRDVRDRLLLPILLPVGILIGMLALMFSFSRILLNTSADAATAVALIVAFSILAGAGVLSGRRRGRVHGAALGSLLGIVAGVAMLAGGIALALAGPGGEGAEGTGTGAAPGGGGPTVDVVAQNIQFDTTQIHLQAGAEATLSFDNQDAGVPHNLAIYPDEQASSDPSSALFGFDPLPGPAKKTFTIPALKEGEYYFHCDVHPTMHGTVVVRPGSGGGEAPPSPSSEGGGSAAGATVSVTASQIQFDTTELKLQAGAPTTLEIDNQDAGVPHNLSIYDGSDQLFTFEPFPGPARKTLTISGLPAGSYTFQCDVHPTMKGTVSVS